jgi:hypothetical protein
MHRYSINQIIVIVTPVTDSTTQHKLERIGQIKTYSGVGTGLLAYR